MIPVFSGKETTSEEKIDKLVTGYTDWLTQNPDILFFIFREIKSDPQNMETRLNTLLPERSVLKKQTQKLLMSDKMSTAEMFHFMANVVGLIVTPFFLKHALQGVANIDDKQFKELIEERKKLIPIWMRAIKKSK